MPHPMDSPGFGTRGIHGKGRGVEPDTRGSPVSIPLVQASTFAFDSPEEMVEVFEGRRPGYVYSRYHNPTVATVEEKIALLENAERALLFSSGMAAIHATLWSRLKNGDALLASQDLYGGTTELLQSHLTRLGVRIIRARPDDSEQWARALAERPSVVFLETPTNPLLRVFDGPQVTAQAKQGGATVIVDNTFATPILQNPLEWGADLVIHSATKYLGGHSDVLLGTVAGRELDIDRVESVRRAQGAAPDPFAAWLLNRGLATLRLRVRQQSETALALARWMSEDGKVKRVHYPGLPQAPDHKVALRQMRGFGGMFAIELSGGIERVFAFLHGLKLIRLATSLGGAETLVSHPATSSHRMVPDREREVLGIATGLVRFSVGLEDVEDLLQDLSAALTALPPEAT